MKTRMLFKTLFLLGILAVATPSVSFATVTDPATEQTAAYARQLNNRLEEIKAMDTKNMTKAEKKALRTEVKQIKKELKEVSGGVYLSIGAIIIIALLLILLL